MSIPNEPAPSYEASLASARPAYTSKDLNDVWQSAQDASEAYREEAPAAAGPVSLSRKLWAVGKRFRVHVPYDLYYADFLLSIVLCFLLFMIANGICVFGMLCAVGVRMYFSFSNYSDKSTVQGMDEQDDSMKRIIIAAVISGMLTASLTSFLAFTAYCAFEHRARASREVSV